MPSQEMQAGEKLGQRLYKYIGDKLIQCRLIKIKNENHYVVKTTDGAKVNLNAQQYKSYTKLKEDGIVLITKVELDDSVPDIIVSFFRYKDLSKHVPYAVCRQNVYDVYSNTIENDGGAMYIGCSVSKDTCPKNIKFSIMRACNKILLADHIAVYYDDTIDSIMECLEGTGHMLEYDKTMGILYEGFIKGKVRGQCSSVRQLLVENHFIQDVYRGFKVLKTNFPISGNEKFYPEYFRYVEDIIKVQLVGPVITEFTRDIDITKIQDKYIILLDSDNKLFILSYTEGEYINRPYERLHDTSEVDALLNRLGK